MGTQWDVDARDATLISRWYIAGMRLMRDKEAFEGSVRTRREALKRQRAGDHGPSRLTRLRCEVRPGTFAQVQLWTLRSRRASSHVRVLYLHGGGYVHPLTSDYWRLLRSLASDGAEVIVPAYPLAPGATVDDVLPILLDLVTSLADDPTPTVIMGDSAGGALAIVLAQRLRDQGRRQVAAIIALCPWLDPTLSQPEVEDLESTDPMLAESGLRAAGRWWAGRRDPADPLLSPLHGGLDGLPPVDVLIGDRDILRPAVDLLAEQAERTDIDLHVHEVRSMFHVWMTRAIPEGRRTRRLLSDLVRQRAATAVPFRP
ncbi:MAG: Alpha/beta hydrolase fold-3 domain protein [Marmoricola sp.]|nr:Alpha/beta hydrolase fold-3 domain protein [Marmoricola sp.]